LNTKALFLSIAVPCAWGAALSLPLILCGCTQNATQKDSGEQTTSNEEGSTQQSASEGTSGSKKHFSGLFKKHLRYESVKTVPAEVQNLALPLHLNGTIEPDFNKEVDVTSHLSGRVQKVLVTPGEAVKAGQALTVIESRDVSELEAELVEAKLKLTGAKNHETREKIIYDEQIERPKSLIEAQTGFKDAGARRDLAESEYKRIESLYKEKIIAAKEYSTAKAELAHAQAHYEQATTGLQREQHMFQNKALLKTDYQTAKAETHRSRQHLDTLSQRLEFLGMTPAGIKRTIDSGKLSGELTIFATVPGVITHMEVAEGEVVHPDKPMFTITDLSVVLVRADLPETHLSRVQLGTGVKIKVAGYPDQVFSGKVSFISERVTPETHMVAIRVRLENPNRQLKKNMSAEIDLEPTLVKVLVCPKAAIFETKGQPHVFVKNAQGAFDERTITTGAETAEVTEICSGVKPGDLIAIDNLDKLRAELNEH
jgi:cobalt-zinc-cadmium efflux system membrane fusion protein